MGLRLLLRVNVKQATSVQMIVAVVVHALAITCWYVLLMCVNEY